MKAYILRLVVILTLISWKLCLVGCGTTGGTKFQKLIPPISATKLETSLEGRFTTTKVEVTDQVATETEVTAKVLLVEHRNPWVTFRLRAENWVRRIVGAPPPPPSPAPRSRRPGKRKERGKAVPPEPSPNRAGALPRRGTHPFRGEPVMTEEEHAAARIRTAPRPGIRSRIALRFPVG